MEQIENLAKSITVEILDKLEFPYNAVAVTKEGNNIIRINVDTDEASLLIGWHGETINALQHIIKSLLWNQGVMTEPFFLIVDTDGYKKRQEENVIEIAEQRAKGVNESNTESLLPPMSPYFRRIIHLHFADNNTFPGIKTESYGDGELRQVKLVYSK